MSIFNPDHCFDSVLHITPCFLKRHAIEALALDLDNTLAPYRHRQASPAVAAWLASMHASGIKLAVVSNAREERVKSFCAPLGLAYISSAGKPRRGCYKRVARLMRIEPRKIGMVGDQLFTDVQGAKRSGFCAIRVKPLTLTNPLFRLRNWLETPFLRPSSSEEGGL